MTIDRLLISHKTLEAVRDIRTTKIAEHTICSCTFCPIYRGETSNSNLPSHSHSRNLGSDFLFPGYFDEISHLVDLSLHQKFLEKV